MSETLQAVYGCLAIADFSAQVLLRRHTAGAERPMVVLEGNKPWEHVCAANTAARALGVGAGMTRVEVETFGLVKILYRSETEETAASAALLDCAGLFSPRIQHFRTAPVWEVVLDLTGTERLLGESAALGATLLDRMDGLGLHVHLALCANVDAGRCCARDAARRVGAQRLRVIPPGSERAAMALLPLDVLDLTPDHAERLGSWGIDTLGELAALPEIDLIARLGQAGKRIRQRALGQLPHLLEPLPDRFKLEAAVEFDAPIDTVEQVLFCANPMLEQLILRAASRTLALAAVTVTMQIELPADRALGATPEAVAESALARTIRPAIPTLDRTLLLKMLQLDLDAHPAPGPIIRVQLTAEPGDASRVQLGLFSPPMPEPTRFEDTHARLRALVGDENVGRIRPLDSHVPDPYRMERFKLPPAAVHTPTPKPAGAAPASALRRLRPPVEVRVWQEGRAIRSFAYEARRFEVRRCYGPWRTSGEWWGPGVWSYDAWDLAAQAPDGELLVCVLGHDLLRKRWLLEGVYD